MSDPYIITQENSTSPVLLIADHASRDIPAEYNALGIEDPALLRRHVAWDIGIEDVTRRMSEKLQATAVYATFSRLLMDANRYPDDPASTPAVSDGVHVPANVTISEADRKQRLERFFTPYHAKLRKVLEAKQKTHALPLVFSMHSFTPVMDDYERPWHIGILWDKDERLAVPMMEILRKNPTLVVGDNEPYSAREPFGYTMNEHGTKLDIPHVVVEIRQDLIDTHHGAEQWANLMVDVVGQLSKKLTAP
ncbi:MAG: N-formylglutamate amidohydrolase [Sneathiella sp.]